MAVTVNSNPTATITASGSTTLCPGSSVTLTASQGSSYNWSNGATTQSITVSNAGSYSVTVSNGTCSATSSPMAVTVNSNPTATITANGSTTLSTGQTVTLNANNGSAYLWSNGATTQSITVSTAGTYSVIVTNSSGCSATSNSIVVTSNAQAPIATITSSSVSNAICVNQSITLTANAGLGYVWLPTLQATQSITITTAGNYTVNVLNADGSTSTATIAISQAPIPNMPDITYNYVPNSAYQLKAFEASAMSYLWGGGQTTASIIVTTPGNYTARAINAYGCTSPAATIKISSLATQSCVKPDMLSAFNIINNKATLSWNPAISADSFKVSYWIKGTTNVINKYVRNANTLAINELNAGTIYEWTVTAICNNGTYVSDKATFTTLAGTTSCGSTVLNTSTTNISNSSAQLNWYGTTSNSITIRYKKVSSSAYTYKTIIVGNTSAWGYSLTGLLPSSTYQWSVQTSCGNVSSPYSTDVYFTTLSACPLVATPVVVNVTTTSAQVKWTPSNLVSLVQIRYAPEGTTNYKYMLASAASGTTTLNNLTAGTRYTVQIRSMCSYISYSSFCSPLVFTTGVARLSDNSMSGFQLNAYPNPANDRITYAFNSSKEGKYSLKLCDMTGRELIQEIQQATEGVNTGYIDLTKYSTGIYLLVIKQGGQEGHFRFQVNR
jgi:hypothetical protein